MTYSPQIPFLKATKDNKVTLFFFPDRDDAWLSGTSCSPNVGLDYLTFNPTRSWFGRRYFSECFELNAFPSLWKCEFYLHFLHNAALEIYLQFGEPCFFLLT